MTSALIVSCVEKVCALLTTEMSKIAIEAQAVYLNPRTFLDEVSELHWQWYYADCAKQVSGVLGIRMDSLRTFKVATVVNR